MIRITKLPNGTLLVPSAFNEDGAFVDAVTHITPGSKEYEVYLQRYKKEQEVFKDEV